MAHRSTKKWIAAAVAVLAASLATVCLQGCQRGNGPESETGPIPEVTVVAVKAGSLAEELTVTGNLAGIPNRDAKLSPLVPGRISRMLVNEGDRVSVGELLAELDNAPLKDEERQADAAVAQARANVENARLSAARNEGLLQRGIAARKEVEDARTQLAVNQAALKQAEAVRSAARSQIARGSIRAPFNGTVVRRFLGIGDQVDGSGTQPVLEVADIDTLELIGTIPASRLGGIKTGEQFTFFVASAPDSTFTGKVEAILPAVDPATNNGAVRIRIENRKHLLKLGEFVSVQLPVTGAENRLIVPREAIYPDESGEPHVYKVVGEEAVSIPVEVGVRTKDEVEILSGVQAGDLVIRAGGYGLLEKSHVRVK